MFVIGIELSALEKWAKRKKLRDKKTILNLTRGQLQSRATP